MFLTQTIKQKGEEKHKKSIHLEEIETVSLSRVHIDIYREEARRLDSKVQLGLYYMLPPGEQGLFVKMARLRWKWIGRSKDNLPRAVCRNTVYIYAVLWGNLYIKAPPPSKKKTPHKQQKENVPEGDLRPVSA